MRRLYEKCFGEYSCRKMGPVVFGDRSNVREAQPSAQTQTKGYHSQPAGTAAQPTGRPSAASLARAAKHKESMQKKCAMQGQLTKTHWPNPASLAQTEKHATNIRKRVDCQSTNDQIARMQPETLHCCLLSHMCHTTDMPAV